MVSLPSGASASFNAHQKKRLECASILPAAPLSSTEVSAGVRGAGVRVLWTRDVPSSLSKEVRLSRTWHGFPWAHSGSFALVSSPVGWRKSMVLRKPHGMDPAGSVCVALSLSLFSLSLSAE